MRPVSTSSSARATRGGGEAAAQLAPPSSPSPQRRRGPFRRRRPAETTRALLPNDTDDPLAACGRPPPPATTTGRREALVRLGGGGAVALAVAASSVSGARAAFAAPAASSGEAASSCPAGVRFDLAAAILRSAYAGFDAAAPLAPAAAERGGDEARAPRDRDRRRAALRERLEDLRRREYRYYLFEGPTREGERARPGYVAPPAPSRYAAEVAPLLAALEQQEEEGGSPAGIAAAAVPPPIFDFAVWSLFKAIAAELPPSQAVGGARSVLNAECGRALARAVGGDLLDTVRRERPQAQQAQPAVAPFAAVAECFQAAMDRLTDGGYCCAWQVTYGDQPGSWPSDWVASEPKVAGDARVEAARTLGRSEPLPLQLRVARPADVGASVALRNEEWGFCARLVAGVFAAFLEQGGYGALVSATVGAPSPAVVDAGDVYYAQDAPMARPSSLRDRLLLALGDPLVEVVVSFTPETEVQDWSVVVPAAAAAAAAAGGRVVAGAS